MSGNYEFYHVFDVSIFFLYKIIKLKLRMKYWSSHLRQRNMWENFVHKYDFEWKQVIY